MEKKEDETMGHRSPRTKLKEKINAALREICELDSANGKREVTDHKNKLRDLRTTANQFLNNGEIERLNDLQEEVKEFNTLLGGHMEEVEKLTQKLHAFEMEYTKLNFPFPSFAEFKEGYDEKLREKIRIRKEEAEEGRRNKNKSLVELLQQLDQSDIEGRKALNGIKVVAIKAGSYISCLLVDYFVGILQDKPKQLERKIEAVKNTIQSVSLGESSAIIDMFVSVLEFVGREINITPSGSAKEDEKNENLSYNEEENDFLGAMFFQVLNLEVAFGRPSFLMQFPRKETLKKIGQDMSKSFQLNLERIKKYELSAMSYEFWKLEDQETRKRLEVGIKERWYKLSFSKDMTEKVESLHVK